MEVSEINSGLSEILLSATSRVVSDTISCWVTYLFSIRAFMFLPVKKFQVCSTERPLLEDKIFHFNHLSTIFVIVCFHF